MTTTADTPTPPQVIEKPWGRIVRTEMGDIPIIKHRRLYVLDPDFSLSPDSLTGSVFHVTVDGELIWQGVVVAEPSPGKYLCEIERLDQTATNVQRLFTIDTLMGYGDEGRRLLEGAMAEASAPVIDPVIEWRLYDSPDEAHRAFIEYLAAQADGATTAREVA